MKVDILTSDIKDRYDRFVFDLRNQSPSQKMMNMQNFLIER